MKIAIKTIVQIAVFLTVFLVTSCGSNTSEQQMEDAKNEEIIFQDTTTTAAESPAMDSIISESEESELNPIETEHSSSRSPASENPTIEKTTDSTKIGKVIYYCPTHMLEGSHNLVTVTITNEEITAAIKKLADRITAQTINDIDTSDIKASTIQIAKTMKVELKINDGDFDFVSKPNNEELTFDGKNDMIWDWIVKPNHIGNHFITIIISAFDESSKKWKNEEIVKEFKVDIKVDPQSYLSKLWEFLKNNPIWIFTQILFPVVGFYLGRKKSKKVR